MAIFLAGYSIVGVEGFLFTAICCLLTVLGKVKGG